MLFNREGMINPHQGPIHDPHASQVQSPPRGPITKGCMIKPLE